VNGVVGWYGPTAILSGATLQSALAGASATGDPTPAPHHPITCPGPLTYDELGRLGCEHVTVGPDDARTQHALDHTIALLVLQCLHEQPEGTP
jgi:hypothetical protein